jgi:hypothetical protein
MTIQEGAAGTEPGSRKPLWKRLFKHSFLILFVAFIVSVTAIAHIYGPYTGKVVDLETGAPIEGAAVLMEFRTESFYASGASADAVETLTDANGEFRISWYLAITFHPLSSWKPDGYVTIFKPGFGAYPGHDDSKPLFMPNGTLPQNEYVTIMLPRLKTMEERKRNWLTTPNIPERKMRNLLKLESEERVNLGFKP